MINLFDHLFCIQKLDYKIYLLWQIRENPHSSRNISVIELPTVPEGNYVNVLFMVSEEKNDKYLYKFKKRR